MTPSRRRRRNEGNSTRTHSGRDEAFANPGSARGRLAFARAVGEFGAVILMSGNLPFKTEVASHYVFQHLNGGDTTGAAALAVLLLAICLAF